VTWKVHREAVLLLGGGRALLLQIAHPRIAAGVADHSDFRKDPLGRLRRTLDTMLTITFGTAEEAAAAWSRVEKIHATVRGRIPTPIGPYPAGTPYSAYDPELRLWVHATLLDTAIQVYRRYVGDLGPSAWHRYYEESRIAARWFGIPQELVPGDLPAFRRYFHGMVHGDRLAISEPAREIARSILQPPLPLAPPAVFAPLRLVTAGLLPAHLRRGFGLAWTRAHRLLFAVEGALLRRLLPLAPEALRVMPAARAAERRLAVSRSGLAQ
jgi:uncharacterized protein (DUF2236 family)